MLTVREPVSTRFQLLSRLVLCALFWTCSLSYLAAAEVRGQVRFGGLPVPGATVTAIQGDRKLATITDPRGNYSFPDLADGTWTIQVEMQCFSTARREVTVGPGASVDEWELRLLPLNEIKLDTRPAVQPGGQTAAAVEPEPRQGFRRADLNAVNAAAPPAPEDQEPKPEVFDDRTPDDLVLRASDGLLINGSANNSASSPFGLWPAFGNYRKSPGSLYNGNFGFILDNSALDARSFSFTGQDIIKPSYNRVTGVASLGGPLRIPHLLKDGPVVSVNYQWARNSNVSTQPGLVPTLAQRDGDFSQTLNALGKPVEIFDPETGLPFPGNAVPQSRISPQARALMALYPLPNFAGAPRYNYQLPIAGDTHQDSFQSHFNKTLNRNNRLYGTFSYQSTRVDNPDLFGFLDTADSTGLNTSVNWQRNFGARLMFRLGYQFSRMVSRSTPFFQDRQNVSGDAGITGNNQEPVNWGPPSLVFSGGITPLYDGRPSFNRDQTSGLTYGVFWVRGRHNLSFGADFRRQQFNRLSQQDPRGTFTFTGAATQAIVNGLPAAGTGSDFADFLLGVPDASTIAFGNADKYFRASSYDAYFVDDWRINPGFTLNAGLRWEYGAPITELYGRLVNLDIAPGFAAVAPVVANQPIGPVTGRQYPDSLVRPDKRAFQPRIGLAWRPFPASSFVLRAGYGIYYNTSVYTTIATQMAQQSPLSKSLSVQNSPSSPLTLANGFIGSPGTTSDIFAVDPDFRAGYAQTWQLSIQSDLPGSLAMTATYMGTKGTRGTQQFLPNTYPAGALNPCPSCPAGYAYTASNGNSTRESGQIQVRRRLRSGLAASLQYTFSKSIDDAALGGRGQGTRVIAQDWLDLSAERALSGFDQRHAAGIQAQYTTGMGVGGGALVGGRKGQLLKEWTVTLQVTAGSGFPLTPVYLVPVSGTGVTGTIRPDATGASVYAAPPGYYLNPAAYRAPAPGHWGNAGRDSITGPAQYLVSASLGRSFRMRDRLILDFRLDAANAINHVTFPSWDTTVASAQFGLPLAANPMRSLQTTFRVRF